MKKMLVKAVALSLVMGGVGFVANDAFAANIGPSVNAYGGTAGFVDVLGYEDGKKINAEVEQNKTNIQQNAKNISDNAVAINKEENARKADISMVKDDIKANSDAIKTKADAWDTAKKFAKVQEMFDNQESKNAELDKKNGEQDAAINANGQAIAANKDAIKANADAIKANKADADEQHKYLNSRVEHNTACIDKNKVAIENETQARVDADNKLSEAIKTKADAWDTAKKFAKVQEMFNNQESKNAELDKKNGEQDAAINANGQAIAANKDAIKANADAIKANKADADEQHKYLNSRVEHNTACIDKNKVAIENET